MPLTPNYGLHIFDSDADYFKTWREAINGPNDSDMSKIDTELGRLAARVITPGDGVAVSGDTVALDPDIYDYVTDLMYGEAKIIEFTTENVSDFAEIGTSITVSTISHRESNSHNIRGNLTLAIGEQTRIITPSDIKVYVDIDPIVITSNRVGTKTITLSGENVKNGTFQAEITKAFYAPVFSGWSENENLTPATVLTELAKGKDIRESIVLDVPGYIYFASNDPINRVIDKDWGFGVPFDSPTSMTLNINGIDVLYNVYRSHNQIVAGTYRFIVS